MVKYCIYCGEEHKKGHSESCPLVSGIPKAVYGFYPGKDIEYNLGLGRLGILGAWWTDYTKKPGELGRTRIGPQDKIIESRLRYEQIAFHIRRIKNHQLHHSSKLSSLFGFYHKGKLKKLEKDIEKIKEIAKAYDFPASKIDEIFNSEKIVIWENPRAKKRIPVFRDSETNELIYLPIE